jgi:hypothetical protein
MHLIEIKVDLNSIKIIGIEFFSKLIGSRIIGSQIKTDLTFISVNTT